MARRRIRQRLRKRRGTGKLIALRVGAVVAVALVLVVAAGVMTASALVDSWLQNLPDYNDPKSFRVAEATRIYSADGRLLAKLYLENRTVIPLRQMSPQLVNGVVAIEDERFYEHKGVDPRGIMRAAFSTMEGDRQGASTITQQYIRNTVLLSERTDMTAARKIREAYLAMQVEKMYTKRQLLEMYMNTIYFGEGAYGAEAAARTYFNKPARTLNLGEAALLAGLPQQPSRLDPFENPEGARARRDQVLARMLANGYITNDQYKKAVKSKIKLERGSEPLQGIYEAPYFVSHVRKVLLAKYPRSTVFKGGLQVYTTLDTRMQNAAERAVANHLSSRSDPEVALVAIDPKTGYIKAMVGGRDYAKSKFNLATQGKRQAGSSFKTFALVAAMEAGVPPWERIDSASPAVIPAKPEPWQVSNNEGSGAGMMTLERATHKSVNTVFARLTQGIGAARVARTARKMGIVTPLPAYPSITLGTRNVSPLEMASAYGTLADGGVHYKPMSITKIMRSDGKTMYSQKPEGSRVVRNDVARAVTDVLSGVISSGTGQSADIGRPEAGKTGTSQNYRDAWFVGYTPQLSTSVWVGYPTEKPMYDVNGSRGFGGVLAAPIWHDFMDAALADMPALQFASAPEPTWQPDRFDFPVSYSTAHYYEIRRAEEARAKAQQQQTGGKTGTGQDGTGGTGTGNGSKPPPFKPPRGGNTTTTP